MQPVNPTLPIPPELKAPIPKTPWNVSPELWIRLQSQAPGAFSKCEVLPTDPEAAFILTYFMHQKPHSYAIKKIYCIHNPDQTLSFEAGIKMIEREAENAINAPKGKEEDPKAQRARVIQRWQACTTSFSPIKIKSLKRTDKYTEVKVLPLWHGSNEQKCNSICTSGFTSFGKHHLFNSAAKTGANASTDIGYFGSGIYFTNSAHYASMYSNGNLLLAWVSMREPYPVVNNVPHPQKGDDMKKLEGQGHYQNYNAHYIPVASIQPQDPTSMQYFPCYQHQTPAWDEIVVFDKNQTVPRFWVELGLDSPAHPLKSPYIAPISVVKTVSAVQPASSAPTVPKTVVSSSSAVAKASHKPQPVTAVQTSSWVSPIAAVMPALVVTPPAMAFGASEWRKYIGEVGAEPPLPVDIEKILSDSCPFSKDKKVHETHLLVLIPQTVNGKPLNLKLLGELVQKPLQGNATKYQYFLFAQYTDTPAPKSHWALLTRDVIEGSRNKRYNQQQALFEVNPPYEVPTMLDAAVCIFMEYVRTGTKLYADSPLTYTRCQEEYSTDWQLIVGGFSADGLFINADYCFFNYSGVGGLRKFY